MKSKELNMSVLEENWDNLEELKAYFRPTRTGPLLIMRLVYECIDKLIELKNENELLKQKLAGQQVMNEEFEVLKKLSE